MALINCKQPAEINKIPGNHLFFFFFCLFLYKDKDPANKKHNPVISAKYILNIGNLINITIIYAVKDPPNTKPNPTISVK